MCYPPQPSASADNSNFGLDNYRYHAQPHPIIVNCSLENHTVPDLWKLADITPLPKESNFKNCTQLRPISLTNVIMRVFERLVYRQELSQYVNNFIDFDQFAYRKGHNTTMALIKCQYAWLKWLDSGYDYIYVIYRAGGPYGKKLCPRS